MALLSMFNKTFSRYQKLLIEIDGCMMKYDEVVEEDGDHVVTLYKR